MDNKNGNPSQMNEESNPSYVGEIPIFEFPRYNPQELRAHPEEDLFVVFNGSPLPKLCQWLDGAFWYRWGETEAGWEVVMNVEYWFRVPSIEEIARREEQDG